MAAVETVVDLSRAPELTGTKSSQNGNLLQMLYGKELNCAKRILGHAEPKGFAEWLVASADWREKCLKKLVRVTADENKTIYRGVV